MYWEIGNVILKKKKEQGWGAKVIETLSKDITSAFPGAKGYSSRNLKYMSQFAKTYSNYLDVKDELSKVSWSHNLVLMSKIKDEKKSNDALAIVIMLVVAAGIGYGVVVARKKAV